MDELSYKILKCLLRGWKKNVNLVFLRLVQCEAILRRLRNSVEKKVLDCGCGDGTVGQTIFNIGWFAKPFTVGLDITRGAVHKANSKKRYASVVVADLRAAPFRDSVFDAMISVGVLEHVPRCQKAIKEMARTLGRQKFAYITLPTEYHTKGFVIPAILRRFNLNKLEEIVVASLNRRLHIHNSFSETEWTTLITSNGFEVVERVRIMPKKALLAYSLMGLLAYGLMGKIRWFIARLPTVLTLRILAMLVSFTQALDINTHEAGNLCYVVEKIDGQMTE